MKSNWQYQLRLDLNEDAADLARRDPGAPALKPLNDILRKHRAALKCQFDAFAEYVAEAEERGTDGYPLYRWTKATIENPAKKAKYLKSFTIYVDEDEVYEKEKADALERDLKPLVDGAQVRRLSRHDTNPANNPQPPKQYRP